MLPVSARAIGQQSAWEQIASRREVRKLGTHGANKRERERERWRAGLMMISSLGVRVGVVVVVINCIIGLLFFAHH